jgi:hypothetical protein
MVRKIAFPMAGILLLSGCSMTPPSNLSTQNQGTTTSALPPDPKAPTQVSILQYGEVDTGWDSPEKFEKQEIENTYTQILIKKKKNSEKVESATLDYNSRPYLMRFFSDRTQTTLYSETLTIDRPGNAIKVVVPLVLIGLEDGRNGVVHDRQVAISDVATPLFLYRGNGETIKTEAKFSFSEDYDLKLASIALDVATKAAGLLAPGATVATTLSKEGLKNQAEILDTAIGQTLRKSIKETQTTGENISEINWRKSIIRTILLPDKNDKSSTPQIGIWEISLARPRPSLFYSETICLKTDEFNCAKDKKAAVANIDARKDAWDILSYHLTNETTISKYVSSATWFQEKIVQIAAQTDVGAKAALASELCNEIGANMGEIGLSPLDRKLVVWAVSSSLKMPTTVSDALRANASKSTCQPAL